MSERIGKVEKSKSSWWSIQYTPDKKWEWAIKTKYKTKRTAVARAQDYLSRNIVNRLIVKKAPKTDPLHAMLIEYGLVLYKY